MRCNEQRWENIGETSVFVRARRHRQCRRERERERERGGGEKAYERAGLLLPARESRDKSPFRYARCATTRLRVWSECGDPRDLITLDERALR